MSAPFLLYVLQSVVSFRLGQARLDLLSICVGSALVTVALAALALFLFRRKSPEPTLLYFAIFCLLYSLRLLAQAALFRSLFSAGTFFWTYLIWAITCSILIPFSLFFRELVAPASKRFVVWMLSAQMVFAVVGLLGPFLGLGFSKLNFANSVIVLATLLVGLVLFVSNLKSPRAGSERELRVFVAGFGIWAIFIVQANLVGLGFIRTPNVEFAGFFAFVVCLAWISLNRIFDNERRLLAIENELEIARRIQSSILPQSIPAVSGFEMVARYSPMSAVAGDFYDFVQLDAHRVGILIADVTGHGVPAALIASMLKIAFVAQKTHADHPARVLAGLNSALCGKFEEHFVTAAYLFADLNQRIVRYAAAGHPPPLVAAADGSVTEVEQNGLMLGLFPEATYSSVEMTIGSRSRWFLYTDGVLEAKNASDEEFGKQRCKRLFEENRSSRASDFVSRLFDSISAFAALTAERTQDDDITVLVLDFQ